MTKEEACRKIKYIDYFLQITTSDYSEREHEAMMMAKKALEQETCEDCVDRAEIKKIAKEMYLEVANMEFDVETISDCISYTSSKCRQVLERKLQALPSVTPIRPKGHWIKTELPSRDAHECSECGNLALFDECRNEEILTEFCPHCGADIRGEEE